MQAQDVEGVPSKSSGGESTLSSSTSVNHRVEFTVGHAMAPLDSSYIGIAVSVTGNILISVSLKYVQLYFQPQGSFMFNT